MLVFLRSTQQTSFDILTLPFADPRQLRPVVATSALSGLSWTSPEDTNWTCWFWATVMPVDTHRWFPFTVIAPVCGEVVAGVDGVSTAGPAPG